MKRCAAFVPGPLEDSLKLFHGEIGEIVHSDPGQVAESGDIFVQERRGSFNRTVYSTMNAAKNFYAVASVNSVLNDVFEVRLIDGNRTT
jgi:hypothetical protein